MTHDPTRLDADWAALGADWQRVSEPPDLTAVHARIRRGERWQAAIFATELAVALATLLLGMTMVRWSWPANLVGATIIAFALLGAGLALWVRQAARQSDAIDVRTAIDRGVQQARVGIRWAFSGLAVAAASVLLLAVLGFAHAQPSYQPVVPLPYWAKAALAVLFMLAQAAVSIRALRRNRRYLRSLEALRAELFEG
jgi:protein-S-isoprenylcysteine O-methyltransferase Ste14